MKKDIDKYNPRFDIIKLVPYEANKILDVGCALGNEGAALKMQRNTREIVGIEIDKILVETAKTKLDKVIVGNIEHIELDFPDGYFDCIIYADVLEHLKGPWQILNKHKKLLSTNGVIVACIPNVQNFRVVGNLIFGRWTYCNRGHILNIGHLRFFTLREIKSMFKGAGYKIVKIERDMGWKSKLLSLYILRDFFTFRFRIVAKPAQYGKT